MKCYVCLNDREYLNTHCPLNSKSSPYDYLINVYSYIYLIIICNYVYK